MRTAFGDAPAVEIAMEGSDAAVARAMGIEAGASSSYCFRARVVISSSLSFSFI